MLRLIIVMSLGVWLAGCYYAGVNKGDTFYRELQATCSDQGGVLEAREAGWDCVPEELIIEEARVKTVQV